MSDPTIVSYRPEPAEFAWTFGGVTPVRRVKPGTVLELWTEDAFGGKVRSPDDLASKVIEFPFVNPQTGPFFVESAEHGDTLAVHFVSIEPSRDWAASTTIPLFGALTQTPATAGLQDPLEELVWIYEVDRARRTVGYRARRSDFSVELPLDPMKLRQRVDCPGDVAPVSHLACQCKRFFEIRKRRGQITLTEGRQT